MFKACVDCVAGCVSGDQQRVEERYGTQLNGGSTAPPWQAPDQTMYRMPTELKVETVVIVRGVLPTYAPLTIQLRNVSAIIFQMIVSTSLGGQNEDKIEFTPSATVHKASDYIVDSNYTVKFKSYGDKLSVFVGESHLDTIQLQNQVTEDIRYLTINGHVSELGFLFH